MPLLAKGEDAFWVNNQVTATGKPAKVQARVGAAKGKVPAQLPTLRHLAASRLQSDSGSVFAKGTIVNRSKVAQKRLTIFCVARKGAKVVAAGRGISTLPAGRRAPSPPASPSSSSATRRARSSASRRPRPCWSSHGHDTGHPRARRSAAQGEPCASCGAPLAADQRYCLECGARRAQARVAFRDDPGRGRRAPGAAGRACRVAGARTARRRAAGWPSWRGLLCLLLALGVGVLIGNSGDDATAATPPPPQVITVGGAAAAPAATTPAATTSTPAARRRRRRAARRPSRARARGSSAKRAEGLGGGEQEASRTSTRARARTTRRSPRSCPSRSAPPASRRPRTTSPPAAASDFEDIG